MDPSTLPTAHPLATALPAAHLLATAPPAAHLLATALPAAHPLATALPAAHPLATALPAAHPLATNLPAAHPLATNLPADHPLAAALPAAHPLATNLPAAHPLAAAPSTVDANARRARKRFRGEAIPENSENTRERRLPLHAKNILCPMTGLPRLNDNLADTLRNDRVAGAIFKLQTGPNQSLASNTTTSPTCFYTQQQHHKHLLSEGSNLLHSLALRPMPVANTDPMCGGHQMSAINTNPLCGDNPSFGRSLSLGNKPAYSGHSVPTLGTHATNGSNTPLNTITPLDARPLGTFTIDHYRHRSLQQVQRHKKRRTEHENALRAARSSATMRGGCDRSSLFGMPAPPKKRRSRPISCDRESGAAPSRSIDDAIVSQSKDDAASPPSDDAASPPSYDAASLPKDNAVSPPSDENASPSSDDIASQSSDDATASMSSDGTTVAEIFVSRSSDGSTVGEAVAARSSDEATRSRPGNTVAEAITAPFTSDGTTVADDAVVLSELEAAAVPSGLEVSAREDENVVKREVDVAPKVRGGGNANLETSDKTNCNARAPAGLPRSQTEAPPGSAQRPTRTADPSTSHASTPTARPSTSHVSTPNAGLSTSSSSTNHTPRPPLSSLPESDAQPTRARALRSRIWEVFTEVDGERSRCNFCGVLRRGGSKATKSLWQHLKNCARKPYKWPWRLGEGHETPFQLQMINAFRIHDDSGGDGLCQDDGTDDGLCQHDDKDDGMGQDDDKDNGMGQGDGKDDGMGQGDDKDDGMGFRREQQQTRPVIIGSVEAVSDANDTTTADESAQADETGHVVAKVIAERTKPRFYSGKAFESNVSQQTSTANSEASTPRSHSYECTFPHCALTVAEHEHLLEHSARVTKLSTSSVFGCHYPGCTFFTAKRSVLREHTARAHVVRAAAGEPDAQEKRTAQDDREGERGSGQERADQKVRAGSGTSSGNGSGSGSGTNSGSGTSSGNGSGTSCGSGSGSSIGSVHNERGAERESRADDRPATAAVRWYLCPFDGCTFSSRHKSYAKKHISGRAHYPDWVGESFTCSHKQCFYTTRSRQALAKHKKVRHSQSGQPLPLPPPPKERTRRCGRPGCSFTAYTAAAVATHRASVHERLRFPCAFPGCSYVGTQKGNTKTHYEKRHQPQRFACRHDGCAARAAFVGKAQFRAHVLAEHRSHAFECPEPGCGYVTVARHSLRRHLTMRHGDAPRAYTCRHPGCEHTETRQVSMKRHWKSAHGGVSIQPSDEQSPLCLAGEVQEKTESLESGTE